MNIVEPIVRRALAAPQAPALQGSEGAPISYGTLLATVRAQARAFRSAGVTRGDKVMVVARPLVSISTTLALAWIGAVPVGGKSKEVAEALEVNFLFHDSREDMPFMHPGAKGSARLRDVLAADRAGDFPPIAAVAPEDPWRMAVSSGSTGRPKGIACSHRGSMLNALLQQAVYPTTNEDRVVVGINLDRDFAVSIWMRALYAGACAILPAVVHAKSVMQALHSRQASQLVTATGTGVQMVELAKAHAGWGSPPPALRFACIGGSKAPPELLHALQAHVCPRVFANYGSSETHGVAVLDASDARQLSQPDCAGRLLPWVEAQAVGDDGVPCPPGRPGLLRFRSPTLASGYEGADAASIAHAFKDGWFQSSDVGRVTEDGLLVLAGRSSDLLNIGGNKFAPERLENAVLEDPQVADCAVVEVQGALGQPTVAVVVVAAGEQLDLRAVGERCKQVAGGVVQHVLRSREPLPRDEHGKLRRYQVRESVQGWLRQQGKPQ